MCVYVYIYIYIYVSNYLSISLSIYLSVDEPADVGPRGQVHRRHAADGLPHVMFRYGMLYSCYTMLYAYICLYVFTCMVCCTMLCYAML